MLLVECAGVIDIISRHKSFRCQDMKTSVNKASVARKQINETEAGVAWKETNEHWQLGLCGKRWSGVKRHLSYLLK